MKAAKGEGVAQALALVRRPGGATAAEVEAALGCHSVYSHQVLTVLMGRHGCVRTKGNLKVWRYFGSDHDLQAWLKRQLHVVVAHIVIGRRPPAPKPAAARSAKTARPAAPTPGPVITAQAKVTRYVPPPPKPGRLDLITRAPGVPGWGSTGPVIRDGAMDFKRHQQPASLAFPAAGGAQ